MSARRRAALASAALVLAALPAGLAWGSVTSVYVGSFYFSTTSGGPSNRPVSVDNGDQVRFVAQDAGHTVEVPGLGISQSLGRGQTFTTGALTKAGTYALYCSPHRQKGHETTLTVRAASQPEPTREPTAAPTGSTTGGSTTGSGSTGGSTTGGSTTTGGSSATGGSTSTTGGPVATKTSTTTTTGGSSTGGSRAPSGTGGSTSSPLPQASASSSGAPVESGLGTATEDETDVAAPPGSLEDLLGRPPAASGDWKRSVYLAVGALVPMLLLAFLALRPRRAEEDHQPAR